MRFKYELMRERIKDKNSLEFCDISVHIVGTLLKTAKINKPIYSVRLRLLADIIDFIFYLEDNSSSYNPKICNSYLNYLFTKINDFITKNEGV